MSRMRGCLIVFGVLAFISSPLAQQNTITDAPEVSYPFTLTAQYDPEAGHNVFSYRGEIVPPTIRVVPGSTIKLRYVNHLPAHSREQCATGPCRDMSNLHFHGLHVSPQRPQDDVLTMMSMPGPHLASTTARRRSDAECPRRNNGRDRKTKRLHLRHSPPS